MPKTSIYCVKEKTFVEHEVSIQGGEYVATCSCGHFVKFPLVESVEELRTLIAAHNAENEAHYTRESSDPADKVMQVHHDILNQL